MRRVNFLKTPALCLADKVTRRMRWRMSSHNRDCSTVGNGSGLEPEVWETREAILSNTEITREHLTPEISLHLLTPNCFLYHAPAPSAAHEDFQGDILKITQSSRSRAAVITAFKEPFWSIYWPGGQALARFVLDYADLIFPKGTTSTVLDLGAGCGATAIAARLRGACHVVANDIDPVACVAAGMNAALNNIRLRTSRDNLLAMPYGTAKGAESFDVIFVGDLLYDDEIAGLLVPWLDQALDRGARIYLGDPGRHGVTENLRSRLKKLQIYSLPENVRQENYGFDSATVWQFSKTSNPFG